MDLLTMKSVNFHSSKKGLIIAGPLLKDILTTRWIQAWYVIFPFWTLNISWYCLLTSILSDEQSVIILIMVMPFSFFFFFTFLNFPFWLPSRFSLFISGFKQVDYWVPKYGFLCVYPVWIRSVNGCFSPT